MSKKNSKDQYYTKPQYAVHCMGLSQPYIKDMPCFEPCVGTGSFYNLMPADRRSGVDLEPKVEGIPQANFLEYSESLEGTAVVTNPPFGHAAALAVKFFNQCAKLNAEVICLIVPRTFKKESTIDKLSRHYELVFQEDSPVNSFILDEEEYDVPCCFQVWRKSNTLRPILAGKKESDLFKFVSKKDSSTADFAIKRVGGRAGTVVPVEDGKDYDYFIKSNINPEVLKGKFEQADYSQIVSNTAAQKSLSKPELIKEIEKLCHS